MIIRLITNYVIITIIRLIIIRKIYFKVNSNANFKVTTWRRQVNE